MTKFVKNLDSEMSARLVIHTTKENKEIVRKEKNDVSFNLRVDNVLLNPHLRFYHFTDHILLNPFHIQHLLFFCVLCNSYLFEFMVRDN